MQTFFIFSFPVSFAITYDLHLHKALENLFQTHLNKLSNILTVKTVPYNPMSLKAIQSLYKDALAYKMFADHFWTGRVFQRVSRLKALRLENFTV